VILLSFRTSAATPSIKHNAELFHQRELAEIMRSSPVIPLGGSVDSHLWEDAGVWNDQELWVD
jgi:hypothetical protein